MPLWLEIFEELSITPYFIISIRNPLEIARSHERRDDFSLEKSLLIWMKHLLSAEYYSREYPRVFTRYDDLVANPQATLSNITHILHQAELKTPLHGRCDPRVTLARYYKGA
jgi:hypothetical protein